MKSSELENIRLLITGGGTGGHLFPGIALAQALILACPGCEVMFVGTERKVDQTGLANLGFITTTIKCQGIKGKNISETLSALFQLPVAFFKAMKIIRNFKPDLVFGVGGYVTGPVILAARILGITTCIHEQNSIPGVSLPGSEEYFPKNKTTLSGNPVRSSLLAKAREAKQHKHGDEQSTILIIGGSQGARGLNSLVFDAAEKCLINPEPLPHIIHQTGELDEDQAKKIYTRLGLTAKVQSFFTDMAAVYSQADLIISRAGATALAEILIFEKPAILVPFPYAADNHQELNGRFLVDGGGGVMFKQSELTGEKLGLEIERLLSDPELLKEMAEKSDDLAKPEATETIVNTCLEMLKNKMTSGARGHLAI
jgi:UDP-N-acetylglucosamine--N-acetylmuramyl-(pentapeptide) pyrophosphoryl-undecaprenol N-acetylglucosamine transferase